MPHHTFTYRHSDLPAFRPEIKAEIVALGLHADDLILKSQGNYKELEELAETLDNCLNTCALNLNCIHIISDNDNSEPAVITMTELPMNEQSIIFSTALFSAMVLSTLQKLTGVDMDLLVDTISKQIDIEMAGTSNEQITASLAAFLEKYRNNPTQQPFRVKIPNI